MSYLPREPRDGPMGPSYIRLLWRPSYPVRRCVPFRAIRRYALVVLVVLLVDRYRYRQPDAQPVVIDCMLALEAMR